MLPKAYPVFLFSLAFTVGIILENLFELQATTWLYVGSLALMSLVLFLLASPKAWFRKFPFILGGLMFLLFTALGGIRAFQKAPLNTNNHIVHWHDTLKVDYYQAVAVTSLEKTTNSKRATLKVNKAHINNQWIEVEGKLIAYFPKGDSTFQLSYGEKLVIQGKPRPVPQPSNPHAFDYRAYLAHNGITHQQFLKKGSFIKTSEQDYTIFTASWQTREYFATQFKKYIPDTESRAIALALILGVKNELDNTLKEAYAGAGAMHVLAVSGLHVGIIVLLLNFLFQPFEGYRRTRIIKGIISLLILWIYAFITGMSPSVMRAVTMFSVVALGKIWGKRGNIYNTLSLSAIILLLYNPYMLFQVGFQLSFTAVVGIIWLFPFFKSWFYFRWKLANWAWEITCVSLAAQVSTFPIGLFYFHQFPNYFFLSNLFVIPAAYAIVCGGVLLIITSPVFILAKGVGFLLSYLILGLNWLITAFNAIPNAVSENIYIDIFTAILLATMVVFIGKLLIQKKQAWLYPLVACSLIFSVWVMYTDVENQQRKTLAIYHTSRSSNLSFLQSGKAAILVDSILANNPSQLKYTFREDLLFRNLPVDSIFHLASQTPTWLNQYEYSENFKIITWEGKIIGWLKGKTKGKATIKVDYLILSKNAIFNLEDVGGITFTELVIDNTNGYKTGQNLLKQAKEKGIKAHWVAKEGAWQVEL